jgi:L-fuculose-phosphate aldolase
MDDIRSAVVEAARELERRGLVEHSSGNLSVRQGDLVLVTPSGVGYRDLGPEQLVTIDLDGTVVTGQLRPSVESAMHLAVYRARDDVGAVIHTHPVHASAFAAARKPIPAFLDELGLYLGGQVEVTEYAPSGSSELAQNAAKALGDRAACLLASHGLLACGKGLDEALHVSTLVERAATTLLGALQLGGPVPLPEEAAARFEQAYRDGELS